MIKQRINELPRRIGLVQQKYQPLKEYKNKYIGKRCFIVCTGPSLTISDLELLENEFVFGMNSLALIHDKTNWRPDFYGIEDDNVYRSLENAILHSNNGQVFYSQELNKMFTIPKGAIPFYRDNAYHLFEFWHGKFFCHFSHNCYVRVFDGYTIAYSLLQLAVYMGFKEIYLLGADCNYKGKQQHFIEHGVADALIDTTTKRLFAAYEEAKRYADKHGITIYNATRGGMLEIFPRVDLDDVVRQNKNNKIQ